MRPLVVTGSARSGTKFMALLLREVGLRCGHENVFPPSGGIHWDGWDAASSWCAAPALGTLAPGDVVVHQVRDPVKTIGSVLGSGLFGPGGDDHQRLVIDTLPWMRELLADPCVAAARYWVDWNLLAETNAAQAGVIYLRHRIEDFTTADRLGALLDLIGADVSIRKIRAALQAIPTDTNHGRREPFDPGKLPGKLRDELVAISKRYGYEITGNARLGA